MPVGTVKFFNGSKGYGFIQPDDGGKDAFVHISAIENSGLTGLSENQRISYDLEEDRRGKVSAINLKVPEEVAGSSAADRQDEPATDQQDLAQESWSQIEQGLAAPQTPNVTLDPRSAWEAVRSDISGPRFNMEFEESVLGTKRTPETREELEGRLKQAAQKAAAAEDALDAMVRRSIEIHGP